MKYLLVILEDKSTIEPDEELFGFEGDAPDSRNTAACLDRILDVCDPEKLGKRSILELEPQMYKERESSRSDDLFVSFDFTIEGHLI